MAGFVYAAEKSKEVRFPLGGIGAGSVSIDGSARFVDWQIMNRPNMDSYNGYSSISVKAEKDGKLIGARALHGPLQPPYMGRGLHPFGGFTYGPDRVTMAGVPHFSECSMQGRFPAARYTFGGQDWIKPELRAFSPFEPGNDFESSLPLAMFEVDITNPTADALDYSVAFVLANPHRKMPRNDIVREDGLTRLSCYTAAPDTGRAEWGGLCLATDAANVSAQRQWYRGNWFDGLNVFWQDFAKPGPLPARDLPPPDQVGMGDLAMLDHGVLSARVTVPPGKCKVIRFALSWYFPNYEKYWNEPEENTKPPHWRNWYATVFPDAEAVARYALTNYMWDKLSQTVALFTHNLYDVSTLPDYVIDAATSTLAVLKSPTCLRLTDGSFYAWEGSHARDGSCEGSCQHVWNYQYALPFLFPNLERSMRDLDYTYNLQSDGALPFRLQLPIGRPATKFRPCADGQFGGVIKTYREWKLSGDTRWMLSLWPKVKRSIEYAWSDANPDKWDPHQTGLLTGRQHHTLDMELFGPNAWLTGMYLTALEAGARMASAVCDDGFAALCLEIKRKGMLAMEETLWNGEYYQQRVDLDDESILDQYIKHDPNVKLSYWNAEAGELKYQIGDGVSIDQLLGQWHADMNGLGDIFEPARVKDALKSIYKYNFVEEMGERFNPCRIYCLQDEAGLVICGYPDAKRRPVISVPYAEETMHGFEYSAACHMIMRGLEDEGLRVVKSVRDRYDGERRNPWNEIECGGNYARSMAAWSLIPALQGLRVDMTTGAVAFDRLSSRETFHSVWAFAGAWGTVGTTNGQFTMSVFGGSVTLSSISFTDAASAASVRLDDTDIPFTIDGNIVTFNEPITLFGAGLSNGMKFVTALALYTTAK